jgi:hypothetical protein
MLPRYVPRDAAESQPRVKLETSSMRWPSYCLSCRAPSLPRTSVTKTMKNGSPANCLTGISRRLTVMFKEDLAQFLRGDEQAIPPVAR